MRFSIDDPRGDTLPRGGRPARIIGRCQDCTETGDSAWVLRHYKATGHSICWRGVVQVFDFAPNHELVTK